MKVINTDAWKEELEGLELRQEKLRNRAGAVTGDESGRRDQRKVKKKESSGE